MLVRPLLVQHLHKGSMVRSKMLRKPAKPFVIGSSRLADMVVGEDHIPGVSAIIEYRHPNWYLINCDATDDLPAEQKILGGETIELEGHLIKLLLGEEHEDFFEKNIPNQESNCHQVILYSNDQVLETHMLGKEEKYELNLGVVVKEFDAPKSTKWKETKIGRFRVMQRLTFKPNQLKSERPYLSLVNDPELKNGLIGGFCFFVLLVTLQFVLKLEKPEEPKDNQYVRMVYDAKMMKEIQASAQKLTKNKFKKLEKKIDTSPVPTKQVATKVIKNIKKAGLSTLVAKIAKRSSQNAIKIESIGKVADNANTARALASVGSSKNIADKTKLSGKNYKLANVKTSGKAGGNTGYKKGTALTAKGIGQANVDIVEEETIIDGGLEKEIIAAYIKSKLGQIRYCYERQLSANPDLHGKVLVRFTIAGTGQVRTQKIAKSSLSDAKVEACILRRVAGWKFPKPKGGTSVIVSYPFLFKSIN